MSSTTLKPLRIGTLLLSSGVQFIDAATTDLFGMLDPSYLTASNLPPPIVALGIPVSIIYINSNSDNDSSDPTIKTTPLTGSATLQTTASITTPSTQPGSLDILLIPGGEPTAEISKEVTSFIRSHVLGGTVVLSICTGMYQLSSTGLLDGRRATAPRALLPWFRERYPATEWVDRRWVADGNVWSSGKFFLLCQGIWARKIGGRAQLSDLAVIA